MRRLQRETVVSDADRARQVLKRGRVKGTVRGLVWKRELHEQNEETVLIELDRIWPVAVSVIALGEGSVVWYVIDEVDERLLDGVHAHQTANLDQSLLLRGSVWREEWELEGFDPGDVSWREVWTGAYYDPDERSVGWVKRALLGKYKAGLTDDSRYLQELGRARETLE